MTAKSDREKFVMGIGLCYMLRMAGSVSEYMDTAQAQGNDTALAVIAYVVARLFFRGRCEALEPAIRLDKDTMVKYRRHLKAVELQRKRVKLRKGV